MRRKTLKPNVTGKDEASLLRDLGCPLTWVFGGVENPVGHLSSQLWKPVHSDQTETKANGGRGVTIASESEVQ